MLTKALVLTDGEADLLSRVLEEVKTKTFEESQWDSLSPVSVLSPCTLKYSLSRECASVSRFRSLSFTIMVRLSSFFVLKQAHNDFFIRLALCSCFLEKLSSLLAY